MPYLSQKQEIRAAIAEYAQAKILWLDTEVAEHQTKKPKLSLIQVLANSTDLKGDHVTILDVLEYADLAKEFIEKIMFEPDIEKVFHNAKYDLNFLGKRKAKNITCTLEMVQKIPYYLVPLPNRQLKTLAEKLCNFHHIDKTEQEGDWGRRPLTENQLNYAAMDAVYVSQVHHRLLQLTQSIEPDPATEDVEALALRYRQIEHQWKQLDTEIKHIKERLKAALEAKNIPEVNGFRLANQKRTTKKVSFHELAKLTQNLEIDLDLSITLTKNLQQELAGVMEQLPIEENTTTISQLKIQEQDEEDLPF